MKSWISDLLFVGSSLTITATFSTLLYLDINADTGQAGTRQIGTVTFKNNIVQRKPANAVVWVSVDSKSPLYNKDSIRTDDGSDAVIRLQNGTSLELDANSLIFLNITQNETNVDFAYGSLSAKTVGDQTGKGKLSIKSKDKNITIGDNGNLKLSKGDTDDLKVQVTAGTARISADGKDQTLNKNEQADVGTGKVEVKKLSLVLLEPGDSSRLISPQKNRAVLFSWQKSGAARVTLEVSSNPSFSQFVSRKSVAGTTATLFLGSGSYYWRISQPNQNGKTEYSSAAKFSVLQDGPISLLAPANNRLFTYFQNPPVLNFVWTESSYSNGYEIQIARDPDFTNLVKNDSTFISTFAVTDLLDGIYYWRIRNKPTLPEIPARYSSAGRFTISKKAVIETPRPVQPAAQQTISQKLFTNGGVTFSWLSDPEIRSSVFQLAAEPTFQNPIINQISTFNFYNATRNLAPGSYYWRVQGKTPQGQSSTFSKPLMFSVVTNQKLTLAHPAPGSQIDFFSARDDGIAMIWKRPDSSGSFIVEVSTDKNFQTIDRTQKVFSYNASFQNFSPGVYYWRVRMISDTGQQILASDAETFTVTPPLPDPVVQYPPNRSVVDLAKMDQLPLSWQVVREANQYILTYVQNQGRFRNRIVTIKTPGNSFSVRDLTKIDTGLLRWTVKAVQVDAAGKIRRSSAPISAEFTIQLSAQPDKPELTTPRVQFVEK